MILPCVTCKIIIPHSGPALCVVPASAGTVASTSQFVKTVKRFCKFMHVGPSRYIPLGMLEVKPLLVITVMC
jgi:hypothetical protein